MTIVAFMSVRGGVATTSSAVAVAQGLARAGHKTLVMDLQSHGQCSLHFELGLDDCAYKWLVGGNSVTSCSVTESDRLQLLRSDSSMVLVNKYLRKGFVGY